MSRLLAALLTVLLVGALYALATGDGSDPETERWKAEAAAHQADADYWREVAIQDRERFVADSIRSDSIIRAERKKRLQIERETDEGVASLDERAQAIVRPLIAAERAQHRAEVDTLTAAHARAMTLIRAELQSTRNTAEALRASIHAHEQTIARLEDRLKPDINLFGLALDFGCAAGLSATAGYGQAAGVGLTCGVSL